MVRDKWGVIINCHRCEVVLSSNKCSKSARPSCPSINGTHVYEWLDVLDVHFGKRKRVWETKGHFPPFSHSLLLYKRGNSNQFLSSHFLFFSIPSPSSLEFFVLLLTNNFSDLTQVYFGIPSLFFLFVSL